MFVNGKSYGVKTKQKPEVPEFLANSIKKETSGGATISQLKAYGIVWESIIYESGEVKVVAYNKKGKKVVQVVKETSGEPYTIKIEEEQKSIKEGEVAVYIVSVVDKKGNICYTYNKNMKIKVSGAAKFLAFGNGDPTNLQNLSKPERKLFNGQAVIYVKSISKGKVTIKTNSGELHGSSDLLIVR